MSAGMNTELAPTLLELCLRCTSSVGAATALPCSRHVKHHCNPRHEMAGHEEGVKEHLEGYWGSRHRRRPDTQEEAGHRQGRAKPGHRQDTGRGRTQNGQGGCSRMTCRSCSMDWPTSEPMRCSLSNCCSRAIGCLSCVSDSLSSLYSFMTCSVAGTSPCSKPSLWPCAITHVNQLYNGSDVP